MAKLKELIARKEQLEDTMAQFERMTVSRLVQKTQLEILGSDDSDDISDTRYDGVVSPSKGNIDSLISKSTSVNKETESNPKTTTHISKSESKHSNMNSTGKWDYESSATPPQYKLQVRQIYVNLFFYRVLNKSQWPPKFAGYFTWTRHLFFFGNYPPKGQKLMMSVFCANTLIAPECWECNLRGPDFKIFLVGMCMPLDPLVTCAFGARKSHLWHKFFPSPTPPKLLPPWHT